MLELKLWAGVLATLVQQDGLDPESWSSWKTPGEASPHL